MNEALVALPGTVTVDGTVTAALLLNRFTANPPAGAGADINTEQASVPAPVIDEFVQVNPLRAAVTVPVPVKVKRAEPPLEELLEIFS